MKKITHDVRLIHPKTIEEVSKMLSVNTITILNDIGTLRKAVKRNRRMIFVHLIGLIGLNIVVSIQQEKLTAKVNKLDHQVKQSLDRWDRYYNEELEDECSVEEDTECDA